MDRKYTLFVVDLPKIPFIQAPTPLHRLPQIAALTGADVWIKRDDLTGFALGGNKGRKLEYFMAQAVAQGATVVVSCGSIQSNFVRQLGAACVVCGMKCAAAVMSLPYSAHSGKPAVAPMQSDGGNHMLDDLLGIDLRIHPNSTWEDLYAEAEALAYEYQQAGEVVYKIPIGGSSPLGAYAFARAAEELTETFDWIVFASSSGSTQVGLSYAFHRTHTKILGIACDPEPEMVHDFVALSAGLDDLIGEKRNLLPGDFRWNLDFVGPGYGVPSPQGNAAIKKLAATEAIFLDPVYSGKGFAGMLALLESKEIGGKVLFWHTGGTPSLFAMPQASAI